MSFNMHRPDDISLLLLWKTAVFLYFISELLQHEIILQHIPPFEDIQQMDAPL